MSKNLGKKFWVALVIFGLMGQIAWVVENMYLNVFLYKMFHALTSIVAPAVTDVLKYKIIHLPLHWYFIARG